MKKSAVIFPLVAIGLVIGFQDVYAQNTNNADLHPSYLTEEEFAVSNGEEVPVLEEGEEGEVIERGLRRFKLKKKPRPRITIPKKPRKKITPLRKFRLRPGGGKEQEQEQEISPSSQEPDIEPPPRPLTEKELIDERIDFHAQRSLLRISKTNRIVDAKLLFKAVKSGALGGIYKADTQVPALRAVRMGTRWFQLMGQDQNSICLTEPTKPGEKPILVFRKSLVEPQPKFSEMDAALLQYRQLCKFAVLTVKVKEGALPVFDADVDVQNASIGIDTINCPTGTSGQCRFALPQNATYDVIVLHGGQTQVKRVTVPPNEAGSHVEFNFGPGNGGIPPQQGALLITALAQGKQLVGAEVRVVGASENQSAFFGVTENGGIASFAPPAGDYTVFVTKAGFEFAFQKVKIIEGISTPVIVNLTVQPLR